MNKTIFTSIVLFLALFSSSDLLAGPPPPPPPPMGIPVDAGAAILLVAGVALAIRKVYSAKKQTVVTAE